MLGIKLGMESDNSNNLAHLPKTDFQEISSAYSSSNTILKPEDTNLEIG